jgi:hypothetical protein
MDSLKYQIYFDFESGKYFSEHKDTSKRRVVHRNGKEIAAFQPGVTGSSHQARGVTPADSFARSVMLHSQSLQNTRKAVSQQSRARSEQLEPARDDNLVNMRTLEHAISQDQMASRMTANAQLKFKPLKIVRKPVIKHNLDSIRELFIKDKKLYELMHGQFRDREETYLKKKKERLICKKMFEVEYLEKVNRI